MNKNQFNIKKAYPLSDKDITKMIPKTNIFTYPQLKNIRHIDEILRHNDDGTGSAIMLYLTDSDKSGHWISILKRNNEIEVFDSYGKSLEELPKFMNGVMDHKQPISLLKNLISGAGYKLVTNNKQIQKDSIDIQTCGRHAVMRQLFRGLDIKDYHKFLNMIKKEDSISADDLVTGLTFDMIRK